MWVHFQADKDPADVKFLSKKDMVRMSACTLTNTVPALPRNLLKPLNIALEKKNPIKYPNTVFMA